MNILDHPRLLPFKQRYQQLERSERLMVNLLGVFVAVLLGYLLIWAPAVDFHADRQADYEKNLGLLQYMRATENEARSAGGQSKRASGQDLISTVSASAQQFRIKPNRLQPEGTNGVSVWFDAVSFEDLVLWVGELDRQGITVTQVSIDREKAQSGRVNARIILRG